jgi:ketosteroid isomerase-like protein
LTHIDTVQRIDAAFALGDTQGVLDELDPSIEWSNAGPPHLDYFGVRQGHGQLSDVFKILARDFEISRFVPVDFFVSSNRVLVLLELDAVIRPTRKAFSELLVHVWTFAPNGKLAQMNDVQDSWTVAAPLTAD